jgi:hypothetical protein
MGSLAIALAASVLAIPASLVDDLRSQHYPVRVVCGGVLEDRGFVPACFARIAQGGYSVTIAPHTTEAAARAAYERTSNRWATTKRETAIGTLLLTGFRVPAGTWRSLVRLVRANAPADPRRVPRWASDANRRFLQGMVGAAVTRTHYIWYAEKLAVVFEFDRVAVCGACSAPSNAARPRGRLVRVTYDRRTHRPAPGLQFCESRSRCLAR